MSIEDVIKNPRDEVSKSAGWGFVGFIEDSTPHGERSVPIGVYSDYDLGVASANAWMRHTKDAIRWEGTPMYEPLGEEDAG